VVCFLSFYLYDLLLMALSLSLIYSSFFRWFYWIFSIFIYLFLRWGLTVWPRLASNFLGSRNPPASASLSKWAYRHVPLFLILLLFKRLWIQFDSLLVGGFKQVIVNVITDMVWFGPTILLFFFWLLFLFLCSSFPDFFGLFQHFYYIMVWIRVP
jgi:hypothetical protein